MFIAFDLDGTLADPSEGVTQGLNAMLESQGMEPRAKESLVKYIGPPVEWIVADLLGTDDAAQIESARDIFRRYYLDRGHLQNRLYNGVDAFLLGLKEVGHQLVIVTSKSDVGAQKVARAFDLHKYFSKVYGRVNDCSKIESLRQAMTDAGVGAAVMVGDRKYDVAAAKAAGCASVGVTWGFGSPEELEGADYVARDLTELRMVLDRLSLT